MAKEISGQGVGYSPTSAQKCTTSNSPKRQLGTHYRDLFHLPPVAPSSSSSSSSSLRKRSRLLLPLANFSEMGMSGRPEYRLVTVIHSIDPMATVHPIVSLTFALSFFYRDVLPSSMSTLPFSILIYSTAIAATVISPEDVVFGAVNSHRIGHFPSTSTGSSDLKLIDQFYPTVSIAPPLLPTEFLQLVRYYNTYLLCISKPIKQLVVRHWNISSLFLLCVLFHLTVKVNCSQISIALSTVFSPVFRSPPPCPSASGIRPARVVPARGSPETVHLSINYRILAPSTVHLRYRNPLCLLYSLNAYGDLLPTGGIIHYSGRQSRGRLIDSIEDDSYPLRDNLGDGAPFCRQRPITSAVHLQFDNGERNTDHRLFNLHTLFLLEPTKECV